MEYLDHVISSKGVEMDSGKISAIIHWPVPKSIKAVRGFLGITDYYRRFIVRYGQLAKPLTTLLKKEAQGKFQWTVNAQKTSEALKHAIVTSPVPVMPKFNLPFVIECDASGSGVSVVLVQQDKPVAYFSKAILDKSTAKSGYEMELMALVLAVQHWRLLNW